jgi:hypothetical protein
MEASTRRLGQDAAPEVEKAATDGDASSACAAHPANHAEVDHARRLAELTIQPNVEEVLLCIAEEFDRLADDFATGEVDFHHPEIPEHS